MTHRNILGLLVSSIAFLFAVRGVEAQTVTQPRFAVGGGYAYTRTNLIPGCRCLSTNGGYGQGQFVLTPRVSLEVTVDAVHRGNITPDHYALTQLTYTGGARVFLRKPSAVLRPFAKVAGGGAHASGTLSPASTGMGGSNTYAFNVGGGLQAPLGRRVFLQPFEVDYVRTGFANTQANGQNDLHFASGLLVRF